MGAGELEVVSGVQACPSAPGSGASLEHTSTTWVAVKELSNPATGALA